MYSFCPSILCITVFLALFWNTFEKMKNCMLKEHGLKSVCNLTVYVLLSVRSQQIVLCLNSQLTVKGGWWFLAPELKKSRYDTTMQLT